MVGSRSSALLLQYRFQVMIDSDGVGVASMRVTKKPLLCHGFSWREWGSLLQSYGSTFSFTGMIAWIFPALTALVAADNFLTWVNVNHPGVRAEGRFTTVNSLHLEAGRSLGNSVTW